MDKTYLQVNLSVIILNKENKILLGKRSDDDDIFPGVWSMPGGKTEISDQTIEDALLREVLEEVGVEIEDIKLVGNNIKIHNGINKLFMFFTARYKSGAPSVLEDTSEVGWFEYAQITKEMVTPFTYKTIKLVFKNND
jgi:mutator protein MutT